MAPETLDAFTQALYEAHCRIFSGVSFDRFVSHVVAPPAERTVIQIYRDGSGRIVGYCGFHRFGLTFRARNAIILRVEAGLLPEYRGRATPHWFGMTRALGEKLRHPFTPVYYLGTLVHPSSYRFFCKYFPRVFPRAEAAVDRGLRGLALDIADHFPDPPVDPLDPMVRDVGWITIETRAEPKPGGPHDTADVRFFRQLNPGYREGHGLVVLVPVTLPNIGRAILRRGVEIAIGAIRRRHVPIHEGPAGPHG